MKTQRTSVADAGYASQRLCLLDHHKDACAKEHVLFWIVLTRAVVTKTSHDKLYNWHVDSSRRSIVQRSRERTAPMISSRTSLKHHIHFSFILKLIIFIYKQLKRPVAFSAVHFVTQHSSDIRPMLTPTLRNAAVVSDQCPKQHWMLTAT